MTFAEIGDKWQGMRTLEQRRGLWEQHLACGGWLAACRDAVCRRDAETTASWLCDDGSPMAAIASLVAGYGPQVAPIARAHLQCADRLIAEQHWTSGTLSSGAISQLADGFALPVGFVRDLVDDLIGRRGPVLRRLSTPALLVHEDEGVPAELTLELLSEGSSALYVAPALSLVGRARAFTDAENNARAYARTMDLWRDQDGYDVRWRLARLDRRFMPALDGPSLGGAFALGICRLLAGD